MLRGRQGGRHGAAAVELRTWGIPEADSKGVCPHYQSKKALDRWMLRWNTESGMRAAANCDPLIVDPRNGSVAVHRAQTWSNRILEQCCCCLGLEGGRFHDEVCRSLDALVTRRWEGTVGVAVISAKSHKRQRRKRQSVTAKREKSQTPKVLTAILT